MGKKNIKYMMLICKNCQCSMVGYPGDDICMSCAYPVLAQASKAAVDAVAEEHFKRTGERKTGNEVLRNILFRD